MDVRRVKRHVVSFDRCSFSFGTCQEQIVCPLRVRRHLLRFTHGWRSTPFSVNRLPPAQCLAPFRQCVLISLVPGVVSLIFACVVFLFCGMISAYMTAYFAWVHSKSLPVPTHSFVVPSVERLVSYTLSRAVTWFRVRVRVCVRRILSLLHILVYTNRWMEAVRCDASSFRVESRSTVCTLWCRSLVALWAMAHSSTDRMFGTGDRGGTLAHNMQYLGNFETELSVTLSDTMLLGVVYSRGQYCKSTGCIWFEMEENMSLLPFHPFQWFYGIYVCTRYRKMCIAPPPRGKIQSSRSSEEWIFYGQKRRPYASIASRKVPRFPIVWTLQYRFRVPTYS